MKEMGKIVADHQRQVGQGAAAARKRDAEHFSGNKDSVKEGGTQAHHNRVHAEASRLIADSRKKDAEMMDSVRAARKK
jgi:hypothetical protein